MDSLIVGDYQQMRGRFQFERKHNSTLRKLFKKIDSDCNGFISRSELKNHIDVNKLFDDKEEAVEEILQKFDVNQDGHIDFDEFRNIISTAEKENELPPTSEELLFAFEQFDADGNHLISFKEFWRQAKTLDPSLGRKEALLMFSQIDQDGDGCIDFGEFVQYLNFPNR